MTSEGDFPEKLSAANAIAKVCNYSRLAVFGLEEKILLHLQQNSAYTRVELTFLKSVLRWWYSETNDSNHCEDVEHALRKQLGMVRRSALSAK